MSKVIAVFGSTGNQGGSVLRALQKAGSYQLKAITRNANSDKAKKLAALPNVSVVEADLDNKESVDKALAGCYGVFFVTDFTAHFVKNKEIDQGVNVIDKAIKHGLKHVVFSGLENVESVINKPCLHFDYKAAIEDYGLSKADQITFSSVRMPMFYQAVMQCVFKVGDNQYVNTIPMEGDRELYCMDVDDIGGVVASVFADPVKFKSKLVGMAGDVLKINEITDTLNKQLPSWKVTFPGGAYTKAHFKDHSYPGIDDIEVMFQYYDTGKMTRDVAGTKALNPNTSTFSNWLAKNKDAILAGKFSYSG